MPAVFNKKRCPCFDGAVYIGRPSKWGNPFVIGRHGSRTEVLTKYAAWLRGQTGLLAQVEELRGLNLVCHCAPLDCHGDLLLWLANVDEGARERWKQG